MLKIEVSELYERFEQFIEMVAAGETLDVYEHGHPMVRITPVQPEDLAEINQSGLNSLETS